jgi:CubicO group peptidase (beta-lactamase class C family)
VTSPNHSPESVLNSDFQPVKNLLEQQISDGLHPGAQLCVEIAGTVVADFAVGEAIVDSGINLTNNSIMPLFSSAKPVTAVAIGILVDSGRVDFDDAVASYVPEFAAHGKSGIKIRHLMNHTSGLADDALADGGGTRADVIARLSDSHAHDETRRLDPGRALGLFANLGMAHSWRGDRASKWNIVRVVCSGFCVGSNRHGRYLPAGRSRICKRTRITPSDHARFTPSAEHD